MDDSNGNVAPPEMNPQFRQRRSTLGSHPASRSLSPRMRTPAASSGGAAPTNTMVASKLPKNGAVGASYEPSMATITGARAAARTTTAHDSVTEEHQASADDSGGWVEASRRRKAPEASRRGGANVYRHRSAWRGQSEGGGGSLAESRGARGRRQGGRQGR